MSYYYVFCNQLFDSMSAWISISKSFDTPFHDSMIKKTQQNKACLAAEYRHKEHFCECDKKTTEKVSVQISHTHCKVAWAYATLCHLVGRYLGKTSLCQHTYQYSRFWVDVTWLPSQKWMVHSTLQLHRGCAEAMRRPCDKSGTQRMALGPLWRPSPHRLSPIHICSETTATHAGRSGTDESFAMQTHVSGLFHWRLCI